MADLIKNESAQTVTDSSVVLTDYKQENQLSQQMNESRYKLVSLYDMLEMDIPERKWFAYPFIQEKSICMVYAQRGLGKTHFAMTLALGIASGTNVLNFTITEPHKVLYIDGEMAASDFINRAKNFCFGLNITEMQVLTNLQILSNDIQSQPLPNIGISSGQQMLAPFIDKADFIVIDNLSALSYFGKENEAESWTYLQQWLIDLKTWGKSVLIVDHSGKADGNNRGTSKKQDIMDSVIALTKPDGYKITDGCRFLISFTKSRNAYGTDISETEFRLKSDPETKFFSWEQITHDSNETNKENEIKQAHELRDHGKSVAEIQQIMGIGRTKVYELLKQGNPPTIALEDLDESYFPD